VNVRNEVTLRQEASQVAGHWARTHGKFVHIFPLTDPEGYFRGLRELVMSHSPELFREVIEEVLIGDIYELIGKVRNAQVRGHGQALVVLAVELTQRTAYQNAPIPHSTGIF
jgi:kanamycin nucleotidyltransferase